MCLHTHTHIHTCNIDTCHYIVFLLVLNLPKTKYLLTNEGLEETQTKTREEESTLSNKEKKGMLKDGIDLVITCVYQN